MVLSIALSVFLVVTIGSLSESARVLQVEDMRQNVGKNHVFYRGLNKSQVNQIKKETKVKEVTSRFSYDTWKSTNGVKVDISCGDEKILYMLDTEILEGKYPTKSNEIAMEKWVLDRLDLSHELNKAIKLSSKENGEKEFILVGIIKNRLHSQSHDFRDAFMAFDEGKLADGEGSVETLVELQEGLKYKTEATKLGKAIGIKEKEQIELNEMLLEAMGELNAIDWNLVKISLLLTVVGGMVIYSLYSISVLKRVQEYGMMRAICSTKKQILYVILSEICMVYVIGALLGIFTGVFLTYSLKGSAMASLVTEANYRLDIIIISSFAIKLAMLSAFGSILLAGLRGGILANRVTPIEAMNRSTQDKKIKLRVKKSFIERFMTMPQKISYKNMKRNKKVLLFTIIAMAIGSTFFMVQSFQEELNTRSIEALKSIGDKSPWCDFLLNIDMDQPMKEGFSQEELEEIGKLPQVDNISSAQIAYSKLILKKEQLNKANAENYIHFMNKEGFPKPLVGDFSFEGNTKDEVIIRNTVSGLSDKDLEYLRRTFKILQNEEIDTWKMKDEALAVIHIPKTKKNGVPYDEKAKGQYQPVLNVKIGDKIKLSVPKKGYGEGIDNKELLAEHKQYASQYLEKEFTIIGIVEELPDQYRDQSVAGTLIAPYLLISENMFKEISGIDNYRAVRINLKEDTHQQDYKIVKKEIQQLSEQFEDTLFVDAYDYRLEEEKSIVTDDLLKSSIAIILILISGLSIYNNINYNLISRIREHGMMKAIGLTKKQFRRMIRFEGLMYGTVSAIFSCIIALVIELGIFIYKGYIFPLYVWPFPLPIKEFFIEWKSFAIVILINLALGYIATIGPRRQVDKIEITEAIKAVE